jgi:hypothetical protein
MQRYSDETNGVASSESHPRSSYNSDGRGYSSARRGTSRIAQGSALGRTSCSGRRWEGPVTAQPCSPSGSQRRSACHPLRSLSFAFGNGSSCPIPAVRNTHRDRLSGVGTGHLSPASQTLTGSICRILKSDASCPLEGDARLQLTEI